MSLSYNNIPISRFKTQIFLNVVTTDVLFDIFMSSLTFFTCFTCSFRIFTSFANMYFFNLKII